MPIFDSFGTQVYDTTSNGSSIDVNTINFPSGLYLVKLSSNEINEVIESVKE